MLNISPENERCMMTVQLGTLLPDPDNPLCTKSAPVRFLCGECSVDQELLVALGRLIRADTPEELVEMLKRELQDSQSVLAERVKSTKGEIILGSCKRIEFNPEWVNFGIGKF